MNEQQQKLFSIIELLSIIDNPNLSENEKYKKLEDMMGREILKRLLTILAQRGQQ